MGALLIAILAVLAPERSAAAEPAARRPVPYPAVEIFETQVREQLLEARQTFDQRLDEGDLDGEELGHAYGELGRLYLLYDLIEPAEVCFENARDLQPGDSRWPYYLGYMLAMEGRFAAARSELEDAVGLNGAYVPAWIRLGDAQLELEELEAAAASYERALELEAGSPAALYGLGYIAYSLGQFERAIAAFERVLELDPQADRVHYLLGMAYREQGDAERARQHLRLSGDQSVRIEDSLVDSLAELITGSSIHFERGKQALIQGDYRLAVQEFQQSVAIEPNDYLAFYNLSLALLEVGDRPGAKSALEKALEVNPRYRNGHFNLAMLAVEEGRYDEAATHFEAAHHIDPEDAQAHLLWATALSRTGQEQLAVEELQRLLERHPQQHEARLNLGILYAGLGRVADAESSWRLLLNDEVEPSFQAAAHRSLGDLAIQAGDGERAVSHYRAALELEPRSLEALAGLAHALGSLGRFSESAQRFGELVRLVPEDLRAHFGYSMSLILDSQYGTAQRALEKGLEVLPDNLALQHLLARLLATCPDDAVRDGERAVRLAEAVMQREVTLEHAETLAMALAEQDRFDEAILWQRRVLDEVRRRGDTRHLEKAQARLGRYENSEKIRAPWQDGS